MPVDADSARDERIKRVRSLIRSGTAKMLILHEEIPAYLRLSDTKGLRPVPGLEAASKMLDDLPVQIRRDQAIDLGYRLAERNHRTYSKTYQWILDADNSSSRNLTDERFAEYRRLPAPHTLRIDPDEEQTTEEQIARLSAGIERRLALFREQLVEDGEYEDVVPALRDAAGGWPHLRGKEMVSDAVLDGYLTRMRKRRTKAEISDAIGAAKELTEATMKALATRHAVTPTSKTPDLSDYWRVLKPFLSDAAIDRALGSRDGAVLRLLSSQVTVVQSLGELRNRVGSGHGVTAHPAGLSAAHALLAVDTAHTLTRYLAV